MDNVSTLLIPIQTLFMDYMMMAAVVVGEIPRSINDGICRHLLAYASDFISSLFYQRTNKLQFYKRKKRLPVFL